MEIIKRIDESEKGKVYKQEHTRRSVRGVIVEGDKLLVIYLKNYGEYKLPGGGVEPGETLIEALKREVNEETGFTVTDVIRPIGKIIHTRPDKQSEDELFTQISYYYVCSVNDVSSGIKPSENEIAYGIVPVWENINDIVSTNRKNLGNIVGHFSVREMFTFDYIKKLIENKEI